MCLMLHFVDEYEVEVIEDELIASNREGRLGGHKGASGKLEGAGERNFVGEMYVSQL